MKLCDARVGETVKIIDFYDDELSRRLNGYGMRKGVIMKVEKICRGVIVSINGRLVAMDMSYACSVGVEYENSNYRKS